MSIGTFSDMATKTHITQTTKQKRIVFGERPSTISAQSLISASSAKVSNELGANNMNQMMGQSSAPNVSISTYDTGLNRGRAPVIPLYILNRESTVLTFFRIGMTILSLINVVLNLWL